MLSLSCLSSPICFYGLSVVLVNKMLCCVYSAPATPSSCYRGLGGLSSAAEKPAEVVCPRVMSLQASPSYLAAKRRHGGSGQRRSLRVSMSECVCAAFISAGDQTLASTTELHSQPLPARSFSFVLSEDRALYGSL